MSMFCLFGKRNERKKNAHKIIKGNNFIRTIFTYCMAIQLHSLRVLPLLLLLLLLIAALNCGYMAINFCLFAYICALFYWTDDGEDETIKSQTHSVVVFAFFHVSATKCKMCLIESRTPQTPYEKKNNNNNKYLNMHRPHKVQMQPFWWNRNDY